MEVSGGALVALVAALPAGPGAAEADDEDEGADELKVGEESAAVSGSPSFNGTGAGCVCFSFSSGSGTGGRGFSCSTSGLSFFSLACLCAAEFRGKLYN